MRKIKIFFALFFVLLMTTTMNAQVKIGQGVTSPDDWINYNTTGIYVDVNTSACGFTTTPHYNVTLESTTNSGYHWYVSGTTSLYNVSPTGFRVYLRWTDHPSELATVGSLNFPNPLRVSTAENRNWVIRWTGIEMQDCDESQQQTVATQSNALSKAFGNDDTIQQKVYTTSSDNLKIVPNPGKDVIQIQYKGAISNHQLYDINGRLLGTYTTNTIDIRQLTKGNYILKTLTIDGKVISKQFIK